MYYLCLNTPKCVIFVILPAVKTRKMVQGVRFLAHDYVFFVPIPCFLDFYNQGIKRPWIVDTIVK